MKEYHKIQTVFKRDPDTNHKTLSEGQYSIPEFEYLKDNDWTLTEKVDGTNIRVMWDGANLTFGGKTDKADTPKFLLQKLEELFEDTEIFRHTFGEKSQVCLYGEGYGAKIQKGGGNYIPDGVNFVLFDVKVDDWWLQRIDVNDIAKGFKIGSVPMLGTFTLDEMVQWAKDGIPSQYGDFQAEGFVARPTTELVARNGHRIITKIKCKDFIKP